MKVLTIGIPTYNGANTISDAIESVVTQFDDDIKKLVNILISDNKSTDNVYEISKLYCDKYPNNIRVVKNNKIGSGIDDNLINIFSNSNDSFVWLLSDDDALEKNSLKQVLEIIKNNDALGLLFSNYSECDQSLNYLSHRLRENIDKNIYCENGDKFIVQSKMLFGLISSLIFNRVAWNSSDLSTYYGMHSLHVGAIIEIMSSYKAYIISDKLVKLRTGATSWGKNGTFIFPILNIVIMLKNLKKKNYSLSTWNYATNYFYQSNYLSLLKAKYAGLTDYKKTYLLNKKCYGHKPLFWIRDLPIIFIPSFIVRFGVKLFNKKSNSYR